jgi:hypothetical protein
MHFIVLAVVMLHMMQLCTIGVFLADWRMKGAAENVKSNVKPGTHHFPETASNKKPTEVGF